MTDDEDLVKQDEREAHTYRLQTRRLTVRQDAMLEREEPPEPVRPGEEMIATP